MSKINKNFYLTINELVSRAAGVTDAAIVDEKSFIDFGKKITATDYTDFANAFAKEIANKIRLSIDVVRKYDAKLLSLIRATVPASGVIEMIQHAFMQTRAADFTELPNGSSPDMYVVANGEQTADYFVMESGASLLVTISDTELEGAFRSAEDMRRFLDGKVTYMLNSYELAREQGRRSLLACLISELGSATAATGNEDAAQRYKLVSLYNTTYGLTGDSALTADDALYSGEFIKFAVMMINKVYKKLSNPSTKFNDESFKTFTPDFAKRMITLDALDNSITAFKTTFSPDATIIPEHESVEFWQKSADPMIVSLGDVTIVATDSDRGTTANAYYQVAATGKTYQYVSGEYVEVTDFDDAQTTSAPVIAVMFDELRIGEYPSFVRTIATPVNARALYYNIWQHYQTRLVDLKSANAVIFELA